MSNGGYKGNTPARETSPEQYPGVWELTEQFQAQADGNWPFQETDSAPKSLRFDGTSGYLSKTPPQSGNKRTWTFSFWLKRCNVDSGAQCIWMAYNSAIDEANYATISFTSAGQLRVGWAYDTYKTTSARYRDPSAWTHFCITVDTNNVVASERVQVAVNGVKQTDFAGTHDPDLGQELAWNGAYSHHIGAEVSQQYSHNLICEVQFIDGQALTPDAFTFIDGQGVLQPKRFTGDYASGPVYSNFITASNGGYHAAPYNQPAGFNGVIGTGSAGYVQAASGSNPNNLTFTPSSGIPYTNSVEVYIINAANTVTVNGGSAQTISANQWVTVASGSGVLTSLKFERPSTNGASFSGIKIDGQILTDATVGRNSFQLDFSDSSSNAALGFDSSGVGNNWTPHNLTAALSKESENWPSMTTGSPYNSSHSIDRAFDGSDSTGASAAAGTAFVFTPSTAITGISKVRIRAQRDASQVDEHDFKLNGTNIGGSWSLNSTATVEFTVDNLTSLLWATKSNGQWYQVYKIEIYYDGSYKTLATNTAGAASVDSLVDSPVNGNQTDAAGLGGIVQGNYASLNPLNKHTSNNTLSNGNLEFTTSGSDGGLQESTIAMSSGKFYFEVVYSRSDQGQLAGIRKPGRRNYDDSYIYVGTGNKYTDGGSGASYGTGLVNGDVIGTAFDADNGTLTFYKNGVSQGQAFSGISGTYSFFVGSFGGAPTGVVNFGQRAFKHPLAGYKSLCTSNLPEPSILFPSQYFDTDLWSGNSGDGLAPTQDITTSFAPSFVWVKSRTDINGHSLFDIVRGIGKRLHTNTTGNETTKTQTLSNFLTNGFRINGDNSVNDVGQNYVSWSWAGGDATTTVAAGSLNSSLYNQSDNWSSRVTGTPFSGYSVATMFDGSASGICYANTGSSITFTPTTPITVTSSIRIYGAQSSSTEFIKINDNAATNVPLNVGWFTPDTGAAITSLSKLEFYTTNGSYASGVGAIEIDGKLLVDSGVTPPNVPSIASTVRSSPESGFSIVTWTAAANATVAHQLNKAPELVLTKSRQHATAWRIWSPFFSSPDDRYLGFDANGEGTYNGYWGSMTSSVITMPSVLDNNYGDMVAYCFTSVEGFSSFGSFQNPSSSQGAFVHLGFEPALLMIKCIINISSSSSSGDWIIKDATRSPVNNPSDGNTLVANVNNAEDNYYGAGQAAIDFLSNGFKIRHPNSSPAGDTGRLYIYAAWAKSPFKTARAR